ncbi:helix-turn-helix domain-containing protein [Pontibacter sp. KCTC 32443]|uniref:helix-turn-helix domain-containing protein n=1 Tax=Pontibacter TaxID=323449 RepID=UPI00164E7779|nr:MULTISPECIES: helix-turn-helix domain-containing protein [Pontibacter]MBC5772632.1 helix-turn-helix domain-containing protein [Pontibacter sp. KCTC 32443]
MEQFTFDQLLTRAVNQAVSPLSLKLDILLQQLSQSSFTSIQTEDKLLNVKEAAEFLSLAVPTLYSFTQRRLIPFSKRGKRLYFSKLELIDWVNSGRKQTQIEIAKEAVSAIKTGRRVR